jgi:mono/diheme cytochrome c family protein
MMNFLAKIAAVFLLAVWSNDVAANAALAAPPENDSPASGSAPTGSAAAAVPAETAAESRAAARVLARATFRQTVAPFLKQHCIRCHGEDAMEGDLRLDQLSADGTPDDTAPTTNTSAQDAAANDRALWSGVLERLSLGTMPPEGEPQPPREDVENVVDYIRDRLGIHRGAPSIAELPGFGNYVDHKLLFTEPPVRRAASPARVWRISPFIFREAVNSLSGRPLLVVKRNQGSEGLHPALPFLTPEHSFRDLSIPHGFEDTTTELLVDMAWLVAGYQMRSNKSPKPLRYLEPKVEEGDPAPQPPAVDYRRAIHAQFGLVLQRDPEPDELRNLTALAELTERDAGRRDALQTVLTAVLIMPEAVFRVETGAGEPDEHDRTRLSPRETAFAVSYALTDDPPDAALRAAAAEGKLATTDDVRREVLRLLEDESTDKPRLLRFFREYFEYVRCQEVFKDGRIRKHYIPEQLVEDADALVLDVLRDDRDVLKRLLTTNEYFVNVGPAGKIGTDRPDRRQKWYYELFNLSREWTWQSEQPIKLPAAERSGLLTHPAWLIAFSDNEKNQAIQRGKWVRTNLLGGTVPDVPIGVDAQLPTDPKLTLREKMQVTRQEYCWKCHERMDPLGLPFEHWDDFGIYRTQELERPVDVSGEIRSGVTELAKSELDGPVTDSLEYLKRLAESRHVKQVFVRHAFRYWMGRNETLDDAPTLIDAEKAYVENGGSMKALVASLLTSDSFLYRRQREPATPATGPAAPPNPAAKNRIKPKTP